LRLKTLGNSVSQKPAAASIQSNIFTQILLVLLVSVFYYLAARFGLTLGFKGTNASPVWPPTGIALSAVMLFGFRIWPGIFISAFLANYATGLNAPIATIIAVGNTLEAVAGGFVLHYFCGGRPFLNDVRGTLCFLVPVCMGTTMISSTIGAASLVLGGYNGGTPFSYLLWTWWLGDTAGDLIIAPLFIGLAKSRSEIWNLKSIASFAAILATAVGISMLIFGPWFQQGYMLLYFTLGLIVISAFHLPMLGITILCTVISAIALWGTKSGFGPFMLGSLNESLLLLQIYIGTVAATGMILNAVLNERKTALQELEKARNKAESIALEKTVLLQELHHRVKNNLQVIVSLLNIHGRELEVSDAQTIFKECVNRVKVIGNIHEELYSSTSLTDSDSSAYIRSLAETLLSAHTKNNQNVRLKINVEPLFLNREKAVPAGMILNELITNSCKHAFADGEPGEITINLKQIDSKFSLTYTDSGKGFQQILDKRQASPIGMMLLNLLVKQLNGTLDYESTNYGTTFKIEFPAN
jgi:two-component sensor histidine kinase/integral membrane sensor domain MASE1